MTSSVPQRWPSRRLRYLTSRHSHDGAHTLQNGMSEATFLPMGAIGEEGQLDTSQTRPLDQVQSGYSRFRDGDVVIAKITPCFENGKGALIQGMLNGVGFGTTELHVLTPSAHLDGKYLYYVTVDPRFRRFGTATMTGTAGQQRLPDDFVRDFKVKVPSLTEQSAIVDYLDHETVQLDTLVDKQERVLALLWERRQALVAKAVTRGVESGTILRDSGIPWLGDIPERWRTERSKWLFKERDERSVTGDEELLTVSHLTGVTPRSEKDVNMFRAATNEGYKISRSGDLVINTMWAWMGAMGVARQDGIVSPAYNVYEPAACLDPGYVDVLVRLPGFAREVTRYSTGVWSSRLRLYPEGFFAISIPVPPLREQRNIVACVEDETRKLDKLYVATKRTIDLLKERRGALISEAVSGLLHVDGAT